MGYNSSKKENTEKVQYLSFYQATKFFFDRVENFVGKGEKYWLNTWNTNISTFFLHCFQMLLSRGFNPFPYDKF